MAEFNSIDGFAWGQVRADLTTNPEDYWPSMVRFEWDDDNTETLVSGDARLLGQMLIDAAEECDRSDRERYAAESVPDSIQPKRCPRETRSDG